MKQRRHTPEQIIAKLREADALLASGATIGQVCQRLEVAEATFHRWRRQYGSMKANEAKRLKELEQENARLKKLVAEHNFDLVLLDVEMPGISGPAVAKTLRERGVTVPIIAFAANEDQATREECLAAGCSDVLVKPLGKADLIDAVARYLAIEEPITSKYAGNGVVSSPV